MWFGDGVVAPGGLGRLIFNLMGEKMKTIEIKSQKKMIALIDGAYGSECFREFFNE